MQATERGWNGRIARGAAVVLLTVSVSFGAACAHRPPQPPQAPPTPPQVEPPVPPAPPPSPPPAPPEEPTSPPAKRVLEGTASWYGPRFDGRTTASGEQFDQDALTAAHATLALGTRVRVTNLRNGRTVVVRINDRGPAYRDRVLDLSRAAAVTLGMIRPGTAPVRIEVLNDSPPERERRPSSGRREP
jgi:peptidoglycan lytic transglycosylase